ncbi:MAG: histidinol-phosphate transaminase [candidate division WOR-3 bacterium]
MINIKEAIITLPAYEVPQQARIKLNQNESPYDIPVEYKKEIFSRLQRIPWNRYPVENPEGLKRELSDYTNYPADGIVVGNGSNELILAIMLAICNKGDTITVIKPGFAIYSYLARVLQLKVDQVPLKSDFTFDVKAFCRSAYNSKLVIFASPNNPTGTAMDIDGIEEVVKMKKCIVAVDEAYYEFHRLTCQKLLDRYRNLIILRTFSKAFGIAGIRLGYLLCQSEVAKQLVKAKLPFSVGIFQQISAQYLLTKKRFFYATVQKIVAERENVFNKLKDISGIVPIPSRANFILFGIKNSSSVRLFEELYKRGILVRRFSDPALENMLRVTMGKPEENKEFIKVMKQLMKKIGG